jgi:hypothetical protein
MKRKGGAEIGINIRNNVMVLNKRTGEENKDNS